VRLFDPARVEGWPRRATFAFHAANRATPPSVGLPRTLVAR